MLGHDGMDSSGEAPPRSPILKNDAPGSRRFCLGKRYIFCILAHLGLANVYAMRMDLSEAAEPMQKHYGWSDEQQGYVLSSFFWGYVLFQIPGAVLARRFGGKRIYGIGVLGTAVLTLALPFCSQWLWLLYLVRALMGLLEATTYPALNEMYTHWVPAPERANLVACTNAGSYIGNALALPIAGAIIGFGKDSSGVSNTWPYAFYFFGVVGCIWFIFWELCTASTPAQHRTISAEEKEYLAATTFRDADVVGDRATVVKSARVPWLGFLTHPVCWTLYLNHFCFNYGVYTMMTYMPKYLEEELGMDMKHAGFTALLPYLLMAFIGMAGGRASDWMIRRCRVRFVRIFIQLTGFILAGGFLAILGYVTADRSLAVVIMTLSIGFSGLSAASVCAVFLDVSPHYAGPFFGVSNTLANISGVIAPIVAGDLLQGKVGAAAIVNWRRVFFVPCVLYAVASVIWIFLMQAKPIQALN